MQTTSAILMIRPVNFGFNEQTAESNAFQLKINDQDIQKKALAEFNHMVNILMANGVNVFVISDTEKPATPDSIFPNNWVSFHNNGTVYLYPMQAQNRRYERRTDILDTLKTKFRINHIEDLSYFESQGKYLEGTGSMVLDRANKLAYACISPRTNRDVFYTFCGITGYSAVCFHAVDKDNKAVYHTNVMMCIAERFAVICLESITDTNERQQVIRNIKDTGKEIIEITLYQLQNFAGNMLQLNNRIGEALLIMSEKAYNSLTKYQLERLSAYARPIYVPLNTIENTGGGSARCMIAEIHLAVLA